MFVEQKVYFPIAINKKFIFVLHINQVSSDISVNHKTSKTVDDAIFESNIACSNA